MMRESPLVMFYAGGSAYDIFYAGGAAWAVTAGWGRVAYRPPVSDSIGGSLHMVRALTSREWLKPISMLTIRVLVGKDPFKALAR